MSCDEIINLLKLSITCAFDYEVISPNEFNECAKYLNSIKFIDTELTVKEVCQLLQDSIDERQKDKTC